MTGFILYEGPSAYDNKPIVAILTTSSTNKKTGNMAQLWILRSDIKPSEAVKIGEDISICGDCKHRHYEEGACYVLPFQAPNKVYESYLNDNYSRDIKLAMYYIAGMGVRLGAYGDPGMLPYETLKLIVESCRFHTGYTHLWKDPRFSYALEFCQASVDSKDEYYELKTMYPDAKSFRVSHNNIPTGKEIECLADSKGISCVECKLCNGSRKDIVVTVHGNKKSKYINSLPVREVA